MKSHQSVFAASGLSAVTIVSLTLGLNSCQMKSRSEVVNDKHISIAPLFQSYYEDRMKLFPTEATMNGDTRYNDLLPNNISASYREEEKRFFQNYLDSLLSYDRALLSYNDQVSYDVLKWDLNMSLEGLKYPEQLQPVNQFWSLTLTMAQLGSGDGIQPFKTPKDYDNFLSRVNGFSEWSDTAIANMKRGIAQGIVLPKILAQRVVPQLDAMITEDATKSIFYQPITKMPADFPEAEKKRLAEAYSKAISEQLVPSYKKLYTFFKEEYLPASRTSSGISAIPGGTDYYNYLIKYWTTTDMTSDEIFNLGQQEVARIRSEMEKVMQEVGFKGDLKEFFHYIHTDKKFFPFKTDEDVLNAYRAIKAREEPYLKNLFGAFPKTAFEIRQTEEYREASASAEYQQGSGDGSRPGIFYVPIVDATKFNNISMEDLFLHEAIPGHHYQISLQQENTSLPEFRRFIWYGAYGEGWALYTESLGKDLGLLEDPYQYFGMLSEEMHRAIRLVVDAGMHSKGWTREQAIEFSLANEAESEADITSEIERYMAIPGQALSYKIGQLKILELRKKAQEELGAQFSISKFHDEILKDGCLPIAVLEAKMKKWVEDQKKGV
jgi:uncharacterized protein (DUF885 family)